MKFSAAAVLAAVAGARAAGNASHVVTEVVSAFTTYCAEPTEITYGEATYTVSEATTLTLTNGPYTVTKPVYTTSSVISCTPSSYPNGTSTYTPGPTSAAPAPSYPAGTGAYTPTTPPSSLPTAGAGRTAAFSGAALAGVVGVAALFL